jgi:glycosyltransferase involved in cell wall biosynthesis
MEMRKIAFLIDDLKTGGGGERVLSLIANKLAQENFDVTIYQLNDGFVFPLNDKISVINIIDKPKKNKLLRKLQRKKALRKHIRDDKPDILITFGWGNSIYGVNAAKGTKTQIIATERNDPYTEPAFKPFRILRNRAYKKAKYLVCQTTDAVEYYKKCNSVLIPNPIKENLPLPVPNAVREKTIVNFCRLDKAKNIPLLLDAFSIFHKNHPEYRLKIYGEGVELDNLINYAGLIGISNSVEFHGFDIDIHNAVINAAMYVSSSNNEGLSNSMLEAMAIGLPIICTDCPIGGAKMMIRNYENGILVEMRNVSQMAEAMTYMADNPRHAVDMAAEAVKVREELDVERVVGEWVGLI